MVQIIPSNKKHFSQQILEGLNAFEPYLREHQQKQEMAQSLAGENQALKRMGFDVEGLSPEMKKLYISEQLKGQNRQPPGGLTGQSVPQEVNSIMSQIIEQNPNASSDQLKLMLDKSGIPPIYSNSLIENRRRQEERSQDRALAEEKFSQQKYESERSFHTRMAEKQQEKVDALRESLPKKEMALNYARDAIETGNLGFFSLDKLADITGIELFRTAKGAQLLTAGKENLLSNMSRITARAANRWMEQRLNSMFASIGQSREANLTVQEMLEGELALDQAYIKSFDRLSDEDMDKFGYVKKDISNRAYEDIKPLENKIADRTAYRMKQIEESEKGFSKLKSEVGKNVPKGTPLTLPMAKLYKEKFGDNAVKVAEKNGYRIPTVEEFQYYQKPINYE